MMTRLSRATGVALVLGCLLAAAPLGAQRLPCKACDTVRADGERQELERVQRQSSRVLREFMARQEALADDTTAAAREKRARLERALDSAMRSLSMQQARVLSEVTRRTAAEAQARNRQQMPGPARVQMEEPDGWLGFTATVAFAPAPPGLVRYVTYPTIISVEPGSPADRAGITAGDKLIALDGRDVTEGAVPLEKLLHPGKRLPVRVQRGDETKMVTIAVTRRPPGPFMSYQEVRPDSNVRVRLYGSAEPRARYRTEARPSLVAPLPFASSGTLSLLGAEFTTMRGELTDYFGTASGVLVLRFGPGTPADRAGLRGGDVIVGADGQEVKSVAELQMAFNRSSDRSVKLDVVRKREKKSINILW